MYTSKTIRGRDFIRMVKTKAVVGSGAEAESFANAQFGMDGPRIYKALVGAISTEDTGTDPAVAFLNRVMELSVLGQMTGLRRIDFAMRALALTSGTRGNWIGEANPAPILKSTVEGFQLKPLRIQSFIVVTKEALTAPGPVAEAGLQAELQNGCVGPMDSALLDPTNAGITDVAPAALTYGAPSVAGTGDAVADLKALLEAFTGNIKAAYIVTDPDTATALAMVRTANGAFLFPDLSPRGGATLGIPVITTIESPQTSSGGQLALIDPTGIAYNVDSIELDLAKQTSLAMSDAPGAPASMVSLYQTGCVAFRAIVRANWSNHRPGGVAVLTGASY